jgi:hypothetical protein
MQAGTLGSHPRGCQGHPGRLQQSAHVCRWRARVHRLPPFQLSSESPMSAARIGDTLIAPKSSGRKRSYFFSFGRSALSSLFPRATSLGRRWSLRLPFWPLALTKGRNCRVKSDWCRETKVQVQPRHPLYRYSTYRPQHCLPYPFQHRI